MVKALHTLFLLFALSAFSIHADAQSFTPRRCGTSMIMEREAALAAAKGHSNVIAANQSYVPHSGTVTIPVILVNFKDVKLSVNSPREAFEQFFNGTAQDDLGNGNQYNHGSVSQYFNDMSSEAFNLRFKVYEPVTIDNAETHYGGSNEDNSKDEHPELLVKDAVDSLIASGQVSEEDAASFSSDGKTIDCVYIIYAGCGQNYGGSGTAVWANTWNNTGGAAINGKSVKWYSMAGELSPFKLNSNGNVSNSGTIPMITGIGVTCHELSHALGLPDFYPTASSAYIDNQEMEYWDLMDGGEYSRNGFCPTAYTAFEKSEMDWQVDIRELTEDQSVSMPLSTEKGGTAYKIVNPQNSSEYFMLECIQRRGWNRYQYGNGLLVYHVNRPTGGLTANTRFNNTPGFPGMAVVPADGACLSAYIDANHSYYEASLSGDLFPGTGNMDPDTLNVSELSDAKPQPNFCWYDAAKTTKVKTNRALQNIKYESESGTVTFNYIHDVATAIRSINAEKNTDDNSIYNTDGKYMGDNLSTLPKGIYIRNGRKVVK